MDAAERTPWWIPVVAALAVVAVLAWLSRGSEDEERAPTEASAPTVARAADPNAATPPVQPTGPQPAPASPAEEGAPDAQLPEALPELGPNAALAPVLGGREAMATAASVAADRAADRAMGRLERAVAALTSRADWTPDVRLKVETELDAVADALDADVRAVSAREQTVGVAVPNMDALTEQAARRITDIVGETVTLETPEPAPPAPGAGSWEGIPIDAWSAPPAR